MSRQPSKPWCLALQESVAKTDRLKKSREQLRDRSTFAIFRRFWSLLCAPLRKSGVCIFRVWRGHCLAFFVLLAAVSVVTTWARS